MLNVSRIFFRMIFFSTLVQISVLADYFKLGKTVAFKNYDGLRVLAISASPITNANQIQVDIAIGTQTGLLIYLNSNDLINYGQQFQVLNGSIKWINWVKPGVFVANNTHVLVLNPYNQQVILSNTPNKTIKNTVVGYRPSTNSIFIAISSDDGILVYENNQLVLNLPIVCTAMQFSQDGEQFQYHGEGYRYIRNTTFSNVFIKIIDDNQAKAIAIAPNQILSSTITSNKTLRIWNQQKIVYDNKIYGNYQLIRWAENTQFLLGYQTIPQALKINQISYTNNKFMIQSTQLIFKTILDFQSKNDKIIILYKDKMSGYVNFISVYQRYYEGLSFGIIFLISFLSFSTVLSGLMVLFICYKRKKNMNKQKLLIQDNKDLNKPYFNTPETKNNTQSLSKVNQYFVEQYLQNKNSMIFDDALKASSRQIDRKSNDEESGLSSYGSFTNQKHLRIN